MPFTPYYIFVNSLHSNLFKLLFSNWISFTLRKIPLHSNLFKLLFRVQRPKEDFESPLHSNLFKLLLRRTWFARSCRHLYIPICLNYYQFACGACHIKNVALHSNLFKLLFHVLANKVFHIASLHSNLFKLLFPVPIVL